MKSYLTTAGFTLLETIIYLALFSLLFTGIFISIYPIFTGAEQLTKNIAADGEAAFIFSKINYALNNTITSSAGVVTIPAAGSTDDELILSINGTEKFHFTADTSGAFCAAPLVCQQLLLSKNGGTALPLNASRVSITDFSVTHVAPTGNSPRYLDISFKANGDTASARYFLRF